MYQRVRRGTPETDFKVTDIRTFQFYPRFDLFRSIVASTNPPDGKSAKSSVVPGLVDRTAKDDVAILSPAILSGQRSVGKNVRTLAVRKGYKYDPFTAFHPI